MFLGVPAILRMILLQTCSIDPTINKFEDYNMRRVNRFLKRDKRVLYRVAFIDQELYTIN